MHQINSLPTVAFFCLLCPIFFPVLLDLQHLLLITSGRKDKGKADIRGNINPSTVTGSGQTGAATPATWTIDLPAMRGLVLVLSKSARFLVFFLSKIAP